MIRREPISGVADFRHALGYQAADAVTTPRMKHWLSQLNAAAEAHQAQHQAQRDEKARAETKAARERLTPLEDRLERLLSTIPVELQREGLSLSTLQASLRGRWRGNADLVSLGEPCVGLVLSDGGTGAVLTGFARFGIRSEKSTSNHAGYSSRAGGDFGCPPGHSLNPVRSPLVRAIMRSIRRDLSSAQRHAKPFARRDDLFPYPGGLGRR